MAVGTQEWREACVRMHSAGKVGGVADHRTALGWAAAIRRGETSCERAAEHYLQVIADRNAELGAFVQLWPERALRTARAMDRRLAAGGGAPLTFQGVPVGIKDLDPTRGGFTRLGSRAFRYLWTPNDGPVTKCVRAAGFNIMGKTATSEFAIMPIVETQVHPPCRNAWDPAITSGGSSGGAGTAVAAGMLPIAHGSDGAGSIRIPASLGGLYGFKPSRGLLPNFYGAVDKVGLGTVNCVSWDVADAAAFLDGLQSRNYAPDEPPADSLLHASRQSPGKLRIRYSVESGVTAVRPEVAAAVQEAAERLRALGHEVTEAPMLDATVAEFLPLWERMAANVPLMSESLADPVTRFLRVRGRKLKVPRALELAAELTAKVEAWFGDADAWLTPTIGPAAPRVGQYAELDGEARFNAVAPLGAFTAAFNVSGQPAASLPYGRCAQGLPFGVQLVGKRMQDAQLLALSQQYMAAHPWPMQPS